MNVWTAHRDMAKGMPTNETDIQNSLSKENITTLD